MKRKLISAVALIMCAIMFLFCGCKSKKNGDDTTAPSESGAAVDAVTDESTEPSSEETTEPRRKSPLPTPSEGLQTSQEIPVMSTPPLPRSESPSGKRTENIPAARTSRQANTM